MPAPIPFPRYDVRPLLRAGIEPFPHIRKRVDALAANEGLTVVAPFLPSPLIERLKSEGFGSRVEPGGPGVWLVHFWRTPAEQD